VLQFVLSAVILQFLQITQTLHECPLNNHNVLCSTAVS